MSEADPFDSPGVDDASDTDESARLIRWLGATAVLGSLLYLVSLGLQAFVPQPDSYQFDPALTSPQYLRDVVAPALTVAALASHLAGLAGVRLRDRAGARNDRGRLYWIGWGLTGAGVALALVGYGGLFTFGQGTGVGAALAGAGFALLTLLAIAVLGCGVGVWGIALLYAGERRIDRVLGVLLLSVPVVAAIGTVLGVGGAGEVVTAPYAVAFATIGYDLLSRPSALGPTLSEGGP